jgi:hypothetical protein
MSQGNDFANYSADATGSTGSEDVWFVAVASDDIKQMNVDQLDEAFRLGIITKETAVWTEGMQAWAPLGQVADLDGDGDASDDASGTRESRSSRDDDASSPGFGPSTMPSTSHGMSTTAPQQFTVGAPHGLSAASPHGLSAASPHGLSAASRGFSAGPSSISPVTSSYAPSANLGLSTSPVALNVDEDMPAIRHGRRFRPERWALAAAALVAIGVVGYNNLFSSSASAGTQSAPAPVLAARPYDDGASSGERLNAKAAATEVTPAAPSVGSDPSASEPKTAHLAAAAPKVEVAPAVKAVAPPADDEAEPPASTRARGSEKESLKGNFAKAFNKKEKAASRTSKVKPRKAAARASTKPRATKAKKSAVVRSQSAFDPLNDSLP